MSRIKLSGCVLMLTILTACSWVEPFVDRRRNAGAPIERLYVGQSRPESPAVCYNGWVSDYAEIKQMADEECRKQKTGDYAEPVGKSYFTCRIMTPAVYRFKCVKENKESNNQ